MLLIICNYIIILSEIQEISKDEHIRTIGQITACRIRNTGYGNK